MDMVKKQAKMEIFIKDIIQKGINMVKGNILPRMEIFIIVCSKMENQLKTLIIINNYYILI